MIEEQGDEHIPPPDNVNASVPTTRGAGEDQTPPRYSTKVEFPSETMDDNQITLREKK